MLVLLQELELEGVRELFQAIVEHDALDVSHSTMRPVVRCRAHSVRRLECGECKSPCHCGLGLGWSCVVCTPQLLCGCPRSDGEPQRLASCVVCTPQLLCDCGGEQRLASCVVCNPCKHGGVVATNCVVCTPRLLCDCGGGKLLASCSNCNAGAFCDCGTVEAPRWRHNCPKHNPDAFCTHGVEGVPRRRSSCPTCNPQLLCGCGTVEAPRRRADCPTHRKRPKKATVAAGAPSAKRQRTLIGGNQSLPYKEARAWVHTQGCGGKGDKFKKWQALKKKLKARGEWPNNIPSTPDQHYNEGRGWLPKGGWKDWCGE